MGSVRVGVAASDPEGRMAFPVGTVQAGADAPREVATMAADRDATAVFVGLPRTLAGKETASAQMAREFAHALAEHTSATVRLIDERFSTSSASAAMHAAGRNTRAQRAVIDQAAAVVILESALDVEGKGNLAKVTEMIVPKGSDD